MTQKISKECISEIVERLLVRDAPTRDDDYVLYLKVCKDMGFRMDLTVEDFFTSGHFHYPSFDTVSRLRRFIQEKNPELQSSTRTRVHRKLREDEFRNYIRKSK